jgi:hypothetical protein
MNEKTQRLMRELKREIADKCVEIEDISRDYGLPLSKITVMARDPSNENMYLVVTNEDDAGLKYACDIALKPPAAITE